MQVRVQTKFLQTFLNQTKRDIKDGRRFVKPQAFWLDQQSWIRDIRNSQKNLPPDYLTLEPKLRTARMVELAAAQFPTCRSAMVPFMQINSTYEDGHYPLNNPSYGYSEIGLFPGEDCPQSSTAAFPITPFTYLAFRHLGRVEFKVSDEEVLAIQYAYRTQIVLPEFESFQVFRARYAVIKCLNTKGNFRGRAINLNAGFVIVKGKNSNVIGYGKTLKAAQNSLMKSFSTALFNDDEG